MFERAIGVGATLRRRRNQSAAHQILRGAHVFIVGDSRLSEWNRHQIKNGGLIAWGGASTYDFNSAINSAPAWTSTKVLASSGDVTTSSVALAATKINTYAPLSAFEVVYGNGTSPASGNNRTLMRHFSAAAFSKANLGDAMWVRLDAAAATMNVIVYEHPNGVALSNLRLQFRSTGTNSTDPGFYESALFAAANGSARWVKQSLAIPQSQDWATYVAPNLEVAYKPATATTLGKVLLLAGAPWIESAGGGPVLHCWALGGRSIEGFISATVFPLSNWTGVAPLYGDTRVLWIDLGTNNPGGNTKDQHKAKLKTLIANFRTGTPGGRVLITTAYPASGDTPGTRPYYAQAAVEVGQEDVDVLCLDTHLAMPTYAQGQSLGYYADTTHYNDTGRAAFAAKIEQMLLAAA